MYRQEAFRSYFVGKVGAASNTFNTYNSYLNRIDKFVGGLDEKIAADGIEAVLAWSKLQTEGPFQTYPSHARSVVKRYLQFAVEADSEQDDGEEEEIAEEAAELASNGSFFKIEKEMQVAIRKQLGSLEPGLVVADGGTEMTVATGRIDIVARDSGGGLVAIELKAGNCPSGALEQVLGYAQALEDETGEPVRAILIASTFPDRIRAAAKRSHGLELKTYEFTLKFGDGA
jgi:hypothetical protein